MKTSLNISLITASVGLMSALMLTSCFPPKAKILDDPQVDSVELRQYVSPHQLTAQTLAALDKLNLREEFFRHPEAVIQQVKDSYDAKPTSALLFTLTELCADTASKAAPTNWQQAIAYHLTAAELAFQASASGPGLTLGQPMMLGAYNYSTGEIVRLLFDAGRLDSRGGTFKGPWRNYSLNLANTNKYEISPSDLDSLVPASYIRLKNTGIEHKRTHGFGAALVGHRNAIPTQSTNGPFLPSTGLILPLNATLDYSQPEQVDLSFHDLSQATFVILGGRSVPLAADFTAPLITMYSEVEKPNIAWKGMRHPDQYVDVMGLYQLEAFQPEKIPVILSHGLISSSKIWLPGLNTLFADPIIRTHYQLYVFLYPTGFPVAYSASTLRQWLVNFQTHYDSQRSNPQFRKLLLIGHSMGGLLTSMQIRDSGDSLESLMFKRPLEDQQGLDEKDRQALKQLMVYQANPDIQRVVFVATPHLGSDDATGLRGKIGSHLISYPDDFLVTSPLTNLDGLTEFGRELVDDRPDGINSLKPKSPTLMTIAKQPIRQTVQYHSIIGQKNPKTSLEDSSDGTVAYWSSHVSETFI